MSLFVSYFQATIVRNISQLDAYEAVFARNTAAMVVPNHANRWSPMAIHETLHLYYMRTAVWKHTIFSWNNYKKAVIAQSCGHTIGIITQYSKHELAGHFRPYSKWLLVNVRFNIYKHFQRIIKHEEFTWRFQNFIRNLETHIRGQHLPNN